MFPTVNGTATQLNYTDAKAPAYIICASGGNPEGLSGYTRKQNITAYIDNTHFGWGQLTVVNETRLVWNFFNSADDSVLDTATIDKPQRWAALQAAIGNVLGDPQFTGLLGQSYQVHGLDNTVYNLISDRQVQINARFAFLNDGDCLRDEHGQALFLCWSHPGSYLQALGVQLAGGVQLELTAGPARLGFSLIRVDEQRLKVGQTVTVAWDGDDEEPQQEVSVTVLTERMVVVQGAGLYSLKVESSDGFLNLLELSVRSMKALSGEVQSHGLIGQTWRRHTRGKDVKEVEGFIDDYAVEGNDLMGCIFVFNHFDC